MKKEKIKSTLNEMTLEEKARLVNGATFFGTAGIPRLGIDRLQLLDGGTGINFEQLFGDFYSVLEETESTNGMIGSTLLARVIENYFTPEQLNAEEHEVYSRIKEILDKRTGMPDMAPGCFPPGILLGATFNPQTVRKTGEALGLEAYLYKVDILLGTPNVNIHRDVLNGRLFEGYSEDSCLVSALAPELVKGVQTYPVAANVKHFAANNQETNRIGINETISKRALEEIYFKGFKACVTEGNAATVMSAYNKINGVACTENSWLLKDTLRSEWGFSGPVISDWGAVYNPIKAIAAGNDLAMPGPIDGKPISDAVICGELSEKSLDESVMNMLTLIAELSEKKAAASPIEYSAAEIMKQTDEAALEAALEGIILLKNDNGIFPIDTSVGGRIILTGTGHESLITCGLGSAGIVTNRNTSFYEELSKLSDKKSVVLCDDISRIELSDTDIIIVIAALSGMEGNDRADMELSEEDKNTLELLSAAKKQKPELKTALLLNVCGPAAIADYEPFTDGIFCMFLPGMQGGKAMAQLITGAANPSGKLPLTYPKYYKDTPTFLNFPGDGCEVNYGEGIYVGYRYYDKKQVKPLYHFGYGLSYTDFEITDISTDKERFENEITVSGKIRNTGRMAGSQVIQIYVSDVVSAHSKPVKELKKFKKVHLQPNEEAIFSVTLGKEDFEYFDMDYDCFLCEEGYFDIIAATSSAPEDIIAVRRVYKAGKSQYSFGIDSDMKTIYENPQLKALLLEWWDSEELDRGIVESNYQYTPNRRFSQIIPSSVDSNPETNPGLKALAAKISSTEKP